MLRRATTGDDMLLRRREQYVYCYSYLLLPLATPTCYQPLAIEWSLEAHPQHIGLQAASHRVAGRLRLLGLVAHGADLLDELALDPRLIRVGLEMVRAGVRVRVRARLRSGLRRVVTYRSLDRRGRRLLRRRSPLAQPVVLGGARLVGVRG